MLPIFRMPTTPYRHHFIFIEDSLYFADRPFLAWIMIIPLSLRNYSAVGAAYLHNAGDRRRITHHKRLWRFEERDELWRKKERL